MSPSKTADKKPETTTPPAANNTNGNGKKEKRTRHALSLEKRLALAIRRILKAHDNAAKDPQELKAALAAAKAEVDTTGFAELKTPQEQVAELETQVREAAAKIGTADFDSAALEKLSRRLNAAKKALTESK